MTSQAIRNATRRTDRLVEAIEHYSTTDHPKDVKLKTLTEAESNILRIKQAAGLGRHKLAKLNVLAIHS